MPDDPGPDQSVPPPGEPVEGLDRERIARIVDAARLAARQVDMEERAEVIGQVELLRGEKSGWFSNVVLLLVSVGVFCSLGGLAWGWKVVPLVLGVVLVHEAGHYVAMKTFGYHDVSMFFIPLFGGAVSGRSAGVPGWKRATVALMGPVPGLLIGLACVMAYAATGAKLWLFVAKGFLLINGFNLLPFYPLDGGHLLNEVVFCRSRHVELALRAAGGLVLAAFGFSSGYWLLGGLGLVAILFSGGNFKLAGAADRLRAAWGPGASFDSEEIPIDFAGDLIAEVRATYPQITDTREIALKVDAIWERLQTKPPGWLATLLLLAVYGGLLVFSVLLLAAYLISQAPPPA
jgi:Zn-dependent protease